MFNRVPLVIPLMFCVLSLALVVAIVAEVSVIAFTVHSEPTLLQQPVESGIALVCIGAGVPVRALFAVRGMSNVIVAAGLLLEAAHPLLACPPYCHAASPLPPRGHNGLMCCVYVVVGVVCGPDAQ